MFKDSGQGGLIMKSIVNSLQDLNIAVNSLRQLISTIFPTATASIGTSATAGTASALPSAPAGYITVMVNGVAYKVPIYNP